MTEMGDLTVESEKKRFEAAWKKATDEHGRLMQKYVVADRIPHEEWEKYEKLAATAERIASEAGPVDSDERQAMIYR